MEHLARELIRMAWQLERDVEDLQARADEANRSAGSDDSVEQSLERIDAKLTAVHGHTTELVQRVPIDLSAVLSDLKAALLARLDEAATANRSVESADACRSGVVNQANQANRSGQSLASAAGLLTPQERRVFQMCFQSGFLSYRDIASGLDITPTAAKNLVNRIFLSDRKRPLFAKQYHHGAVRVGVQPDIKHRATGGHAGQSEPPERTSDRAYGRSGGADQPAAAAAAMAPNAQQAGRRKAAQIF